MQKTKQKANRSAMMETMVRNDFSDNAADRFGTILVDPPWRFINRTGKVAPEHKRLKRYETMSFDEIAALPVSDFGKERSHLYLWVPNALLFEGLQVMEAWGYQYKTNLVWYKVRKDGGPDGRGVGFYFRNVTELLLFGVKGSIRTLKPGRSQVNVMISRKREHSRKPEEAYDLIERCSPGPYLELFAREPAPGWTQWGDELLTYAETKRVARGYRGGDIVVNGAHGMNGSFSTNGRSRSKLPELLTA